MDENRTRTLRTSENQLTAPLPVALVAQLWAGGATSQLRHRTDTTHPTPPLPLQPRLTSYGDVHSSPQPMDIMLWR